MAVMFSCGKTQPVQPTSRHLMKQDQTSRKNVTSRQLLARLGICNTVTSYGDNEFVTNVLLQLHIAVRCGENTLRELLVKYISQYVLYRSAKTEATCAHKTFCRPTTTHL